MRLTPRPLSARFGVVTFLAATVALAAAAPLCQAKPAQQKASAAPPTTLGATSDTRAAVAHLENLAESGRFGEVLARLQADYADLQNDNLQALIDDLRRFDEARQAQSQSKQKTYDETLAKVGTELDAGRIEEALVAAIDAHSLADEPAEVLNVPAVKRVVAEAERQATAAEEAHDWVQALSLFRALDLLFDDYATYRDDVKRIAKHVQVLQLYTPEKLRALYKAQQARRAAAKQEAGEGEADDPAAERAEQAREDALELEAESWETRLRGIDVSMLRQTLAQAARQHVDRSANRGYLALVKGALESLQIVLDTDDLAATFPSLSDQAKRQAMKDRVAAEYARLPQGAGTSLNFLETAEVIDRILKANRETVALPESVIVYELAEGATSTLDDFSAVIWPEETEQFSRSTQGKFYGVGIQISRRDGRLIVVTPLPDTPAQKAGIKAGDIIATVDGRDTASWSLDKAVREITGPEGTPVALGIERVGETDLVAVELRRAEIAIESIRGWEHTGSGWNYWIDERDRIGYIRLSQFIPQTADDLDAAVARMQADGPLNGLIIDLRFNPGGLLSSAIDVVDRFVEEGPIVYTVDHDGKKQNQSRAQSHRTYEPFPTVVLINQGSASASEIVSGALQDYGRGLVVGTRSFGKGSVQDLFPLSRGEAFLKLTTQYYMLPLGRIIHRKPDAKDWGVVPDLVVEMTNQQVADALEYRQEVDILRDPAAKAAAAEESEEPPTARAILDKGMDPQLSAGLLVLKTRLVAKDLAIAQARAQAAEQTATP